MARRTTEDGGAYRAVVTVEWTDGQTTTHIFGPYDAEATATAVKTRKTNPRYFGDFTRWNPPEPKPVRAFGHIEQATAWARVEPKTTRGTRER
jgi:hypothetical protein